MALPWQQSNNVDRGSAPVKILLQLPLSRGVVHNVHVAHCFLLLRLEVTEHETGLARTPCTHVRCGGFGVHVDRRTLSFAYNRTFRFRRACPSSTKHYQEAIPGDNAIVLSRVAMTGKRAVRPITGSRRASCEGDAIYWSSCSAWESHRTTTAAQWTSEARMIDFLNHT